MPSIPQARMLPNVRYGLQDPSGNLHSTRVAPSLSSGILIAPPLPPNAYTCASAFHLPCSKRLYELNEGQAMAVKAAKCSRTPAMKWYESLLRPNLSWRSANKFVDFFLEELLQRLMCK